MRWRTRHHSHRRCLNSGPIQGKPCKCVLCFCTLQRFAFAFASACSPHASPAHDARGSSDRGLLALRLAPCRLLVLICGCRVSAEKCGETRISAEKRVRRSACGDVRAGKCMRGDACGEVRAEKRRSREVPGSADMLMMMMMMTTTASLWQRGHQPVTHHAVRVINHGAGRPA